MYWKLSRFVCRTNGGDLAVLSSQLEHDMVIGSFNVIGEIWLGGLYNDTTASWKWINGQPFIFDNFVSDIHSVSGQAVFITSRSESKDRKWTGSDINNKKMSLCEIFP